MSEQPETSPIDPNTLVQMTLPAAHVNQVFVTALGDGTTLRLTFAEQLTDDLPGVARSAVAMSFSDLKATYELFGRIIGLVESRQQQVQQ